MKYPLLRLFRDWIDVGNVTNIREFFGTLILMLVFPKGIHLIKLYKSNLKNKHIQECYKGHKKQVKKQVSKYT